MAVVSLVAATLAHPAAVLQARACKMINTVAAPKGLAERFRVLDGGPDRLDLPLAGYWHPWQRISRKDTDMVSLVHESPDDVFPQKASASSDRVQSHGFQECSQEDLESGNVTKAMDPDTQRSRSGKETREREIVLAKDNVRFLHQEAFLRNFCS